MLLRLLFFLQQNQVDLIFLDVQMPKMSGIELIKSLNKKPTIILTTAFRDYAVDGFELEVFDYLLKPVSPERLAETIRKLTIKDNTDKKENTSPLSEIDRVFIKDGEKTWFVKLSQIRLFESEGNYVRVYFETFRPLILRSLNSLEERLNDKHFFRASRKHIINLSWVESIETWFNGGLMVKLKDGQQIEISRRQAVKLKDMMSL